MKLGNPCENSFDLKRRKMSDEDTKKQRALLAKLLNMEKEQEAVA